MESIPNKYAMVPYFNKVHCRYLIGMPYALLLVHFNIYYTYMAKVLLLCNLFLLNFVGFVQQKKLCRNLGLVEVYTHKQENKICILDNNIYCGSANSMPTSKGNVN